MPSAYVVGEFKKGRTKHAVPKPGWSVSRGKSDNDYSYRMDLPLCLGRMSLDDRLLS